VAIVMNVVKAVDIIHVSAHTSSRDLHLRILVAHVVPSSSQRQPTPTVLIFVGIMCVAKGKGFTDN
jgi:hypothetical protein